VTWVLRFCELSRRVETVGPRNLHVGLAPIASPSFTPELARKRNLHATHSIDLTTAVHRAYRRCNRLSAWLQRHDVRPRLTLEQAVESGSPKTVDSVTAHRLGLAVVRDVFKWMG
jgi:hypothetical protein